MRLGKKNHPVYRIIVIDERKKQISRYIEKLGNYDPSQIKDKLSLDQDRFEYWKKQGAQLSKGLLKLIKS